MSQRLKYSVAEVKDVCIISGQNIIICGIELKEFLEDSILITSRADTVSMPAPGSLFKVAIYCSNGVFIFQTRVIRYELNSPYVFWYLEYPETFEVKQQREFFRTRFNLGVTLTIMFHNGEKKILECNTFDISGSGTSLLVSPMLNNDELIFLLSKTSLSKYAKISMCLHFKEKEINTKVEFVHKRELRENLKTVVCAFKFLNISPADSDFIAKQCFCKQLSEHNKSKNEI